jgi:hypothetical protein
MLIAAASGGHENLYKLAIKWGKACYSDWQSTITDARVAAAKNGFDAYKVIPEWKEDYDQTPIIRAYAENGHKDILYKLFTSPYGLDEKTRCLNTIYESRNNPELSVVLNGAALGGHEEICEMALGWGASNYNEMLYNATLGGHEQLCRKAKELGATYFNDMYRVAKENGNEVLYALAKEWGADTENYYDVLVSN